MAQRLFGLLERELVQMEARSGRSPARLRVPSDAAGTTAGFIDISFIDASSALPGNLHRSHSHLARWRSWTGSAFLNFSENF